MDSKPDLQHLLKDELPEEFRARILVANRPSIKMAIGSMCLLSFAFAAWLSRFEVLLPYLKWLAPIAVVSAFVIGWFNNRSEGRLLRELPAEPRDS